MVRKFPKINEGLIRSIREAMKLFDDAEKKRNYVSSSGFISISFLLGTILAYLNLDLAGSIRFKGDETPSSVKGLYMRNFLVMSFLFTTTVTLASTPKMSKVQILLPESPRHKMLGKIELTNGFFGRTFHTIQLANLSNGRNSLSITKPDKVNDVDLSLDLIASDGLKASLVGSIDLDDTKFETKKIFLANDKLKRKYDCSRVIKASYDKDELTIDLSSFNSFADCLELPEKRDEVMARFKPLSQVMSKALSQELDGLLIPEDNEAVLFLQKKLEEVSKTSSVRNLRPKVYLVNSEEDKFYSLPTGEVYLFKGILEKTNSETALMSLLAREWAHIVSEDYLREAEKVVDNALTPMTFYIMSGKAEDQEKIFSEFLPKAVNAAMKADDFAFLNDRPAREQEADRLAGLYVAKSGYHPEGVLEFLTTLKEQTSSESNFVDRLKSAYGNYDERLKMMNYNIKFFYPDEKNWKMDSDEFVSIKDRLKEIPDGDTSKLKKLDEALNAKKEKFIVSFMEPMIKYLLEQEAKKKNTPK